MVRRVGAGFVVPESCRVRYLDLSRRGKARLEWNMFVSESRIGVPQNPSIAASMTFYFAKVVILSCVE